MTVDLVAAIHSGDIDAVQRIVSGTPELVRAPLGGRFKTRTALHVVADWPGYFPNGPEIVRSSSLRAPTPTTATPSRVPRRRCTGRPAATTPTSPPRSSTAAPTSKSRTDRSARLSTMPSDTAAGMSPASWSPAAPGSTSCGMPARSACSTASRSCSTPRTRRTEEVSQAFWHACAGGQRRAAERLLAAGADLNWEPDYAVGTPLDTAAGLGTRQENVIGWLRDRGARRSDPGTDSRT